MKPYTLLVTVIVWALLAAAGLGDEILLQVDGVPPHGLIMARVDFTTATHWCQVGPIAPKLIAVVDADTRPVPAQFVPDTDYDSRTHIAGRLLLKLPAGVSSAALRLHIDAAASASPATENTFDGTVRTESYAIKHNQQTAGGMPTGIEWADGKRFDTLRLDDRLHDPKLHGFQLRNDRQAKLELLSDGPVATVVRTSARYVKGDGKQPDSAPEAVYEWFYFKELPLAFVSAEIRQKTPFAWREIHCLEFAFTGKPFAGHLGNTPLQRKEFAGGPESTTYKPWAAVVDGPHAIGMFRAGNMIVYDNTAKSGGYLMAHGSRTWKGWDTTEAHRSAWLWIGAAEQPEEAIPQAAAVLPNDAQVRVTVAEVEAQLDELRKAYATKSSSERRQQAWRIAGARRLASRGQFAQAVDVAHGKRPANWSSLSAGDLNLILQHGETGVELVSLFDVATETELFAAEVLPLFALMLRDTETSEDVTLHADAGWQQVETHIAKEDGALELRWRKPEAVDAAIEVIARAVPDVAVGAIRWSLQVRNDDKRFSVWRAVFPQIAVAELSRKAAVFLPDASGRVEPGLWRRSFRDKNTYPRGWTSMQFMAAYDSARRCGLYLATHDPWGSTKDLGVESFPEQHAVHLQFDHPAEDMSIAGNDFTLSGKAVWQVLRGDWYDAAVIYRDWVRREARWYPKLTEEGRADTPRWMRELPLWLLGGGKPENVAKQLGGFSKEMGVPVGLHWYSWHQIPFDNDYPHYFPTKDGFAEAVKQLQAGGIYVMPYINGRLWDTLDRGAEDFEFSRVALPAAAKQESGEPYVERYGSKEADGSRVALAVMCPHTKLWQDKIGEIVARLFGECGVKGVYIDQIAAAKPVLCFDKSHGHPLGGGHWWTESYWKMLEEMRRRKPADRMLTTECNAEPYIHCFDGYLTWHWQRDGQVPAFPAVYGGTIQMFGRAYRGGDTRHLAFRMKAGQQLVYGEQIGWCHVSQARDPKNIDFLRQVVGLRWHLRRYFHAGEMARPPKLSGEIPKVSADWQWTPNGWWVTTDAALGGAWRLPRENRTVLLFVNVGDEPITTGVDLNATDYGLAGEQIQVDILSPRGEKRESFVSPNRLQREVKLAPQSAVAWELTRP